MSWECSALLYTALILIREGAGWGGTRGRPEMWWGAELASGRLTFSPDADTLINRLCHGRVIHSCLSFTHTHSQTYTQSHTQAWCRQRATHTQTNTAGEVYTWIDVLNWLNLYFSLFIIGTFSDQIIQIRIIFQQRLSSWHQIIKINKMKSFTGFKPLLLTWLWFSCCVNLAPIQPSIGQYVPEVHSCWSELSIFSHNNQPISICSAAVHLFFNNCLQLRS